MLARPDIAEDYSTDDDDEEEVDEGDSTDAPPSEHGADDSHVPATRSRKTGSRPGSRRARLLRDARFGSWRCSVDAAASDDDSDSNDNCATVVSAAPRPKMQPALPPVQEDLGRVRGNEAGVPSRKVRELCLGMTMSDSGRSSAADVATLPLADVGSPARWAKFTATLV